VNGWRESKLRQVAEIIDSLHKTPEKYVEDGYPMVRVTDVKQGKLDLSNALKVDKQTFEEFSKRHAPQAGDIIFTRVGSYGNTCFVGEDTNFCLGQNAAFIVPKQDSYYLYYFLNSPEANSQIEGSVGGSTQPTISLRSIKEINIPLPSLPEQRAIASVLSSLDDKIDLLHRQNKTLEGMAEILFRSWFEEIEENPKSTESFEELRLGEVIETVSMTHLLNTEQIIFLNTSDIYGGTVLKDEAELVETLPGQAKKSIQRGDILFSEIRPANKRYAYIDFDAEEYVVSTKLMVLRSKGKISQAIAYFFLTYPITLDWLQLIAESRSGTFPQITFDQIKDLSFKLPVGGMRNRLAETAENILSKICLNNGNIRTLSRLRDTLLTKLMSGEVRVRVKEG
jgi:type I restriction enzyme S subunit